MVCLVPYLSLYFNPRSPCGERRSKNGHFTPCNGFQSTLPMRGATRPSPFPCPSSHISIHAPHAGSDWIKPTPTVSIKISIHAPHAGSDSTPVPSLSIDRNFNPRSPCGERPYCGVQYAEGYMAFQSTLPMRGATTQRRQACCKPVQFQSTLPMRGATTQRRQACCKPVQFQSTLPMRGATVLNPFCWHWPLFQSTLPMRGATYILRI